MTSNISFISAINSNKFEIWSTKGKTNSKRIYGNKENKFNFIAHISQCIVFWQICFGSNSGRHIHCKFLVYIVYLVLNHMINNI